MAEAAGFEPAHGLVNNQVPYQLGYASSIWWLEAESNRRPHPYEGCAPPSELSSLPIAIRNLFMGRVGVEPTTSRLKVENSS